LHASNVGLVALSSAYCDGATTKQLNISELHGLVRTGLYEVGLKLTYRVIRHHLLRHWQLLLGQIRSGYVVVVAFPRMSHSRVWRNRFRFGVVVVLAAGQVSLSRAGRDLFGSGFHAAAFAALEIH
jgi:hypothetical protein